MADTMTKEAFEQMQYEDQNKALIQQLIDAEDGECKQAASASSQMIRRVIRENGFMRKIIPPKQISDSDLNRLLDTEKPAIIEDMEAHQATCKSIPFARTFTSSPPGLSRWPFSSYSKFGCNSETHSTTRGFTSLSD